MTARDFCEALRKNREVRFEGSVVTARTRSVTDALADFLELLLGPEREIAYAVETEEIGGDLTGKVNWYLITGEQLVGVTAKLTRKPTANDVLDIGCRFYPLARVEKAILDVNCDAVNGTALAKAELSFQAEGEQIEIRSNRPKLVPEGLTIFARLLSLR